MKKKELKKRIKDLRELTDCLISDNVRLMMRLGGTCTQEDAKGTILERTKEPESKEQNDKRREIYEAQKPIDIDKGFKSGGFVSKNNDKTDYMTQNGKLPNCEYVIDTNTAKRFVDEINNIKLPKTEGPESESELKENELPERWAIKSNKDNIGEIDKYYSRQLKYSLYKDYVGEYFHSHNLADDSLSVMNDDIDFAANFNSEEIKHGYAEITFDQFKEHVLKENTISLEVGKKYMTRDGESFECKELTCTGRYRLENDLCRLFYEENGKLPGGGCGDYDLVSEIKE